MGSRRRRRLTNPAFLAVPNSSTKRTGSSRIAKESRKHCAGSDTCEQKTEHLLKERSWHSQQPVVATAGSLHPDHQLYDPVRSIWQRAGDHPQLWAFFPAPKPNWSALIGLASGLASLSALAAIAAASSNTTSGKKKVFVSFDFDNDK